MESLQKGLERIESAQEQAVKNETSGQSSKQKNNRRSRLNRTAARNGKKVIQHDSQVASTPTRNQALKGLSSSLQLKRKK